jgi:hypothetical protein
MHLRSWRDERHQTPKNNFQNFRFAASILYVEWAGPIQRYRARAAVCLPKGRAVLSSRIQAQSRLRDVVKNVMAITDAASRFWHKVKSYEAAVPTAIRRRTP